MIIDCLMNLPLLEWASDESGEERYRAMARSHAEKAMLYLVREDSSTFHTFYMDAETGSPIGGKTHQGYADDSCWARGQAWGIYGFALAYARTLDARFLETAVRLADYYLERLPDDGVCYWDLVFTSGTQERDSSAAAIACCGLLELAAHLAPEAPRKTRYERAARQTLKSLASPAYFADEDHPAEGLLLHAVYNKNRGAGVDECCIWGDYFYVEALVRASGPWRPYWL